MGVQDDATGVPDDVAVAQAYAAAAGDEPVVAEPDDRATEKAPEPLAFITEYADEGARYYRAVGEGVELFAGLYSDGRLRLADRQDRRFAGLLQGAHADLLELDGNTWSEVFLRTTPTGAMQLELRGGPYDGRVLLCEPLA